MSDAAIDELKDILANYSDVRDGPNGPLPNRAMAGLSVLDELRTDIEKLRQVIDIQKVTIALQQEEIAIWKDRYESLLRDAQASEAAYDKRCDYDWRP